MYQPKRRQTMLRSYFIPLRNGHKSRLRSRLALAGLAFGSVACSMNVLHSALTVQPGKQFELGGNQTGAFTVRIRNIGDVPVIIRERRTDGQDAILGTFRPGDGQTVQFARGSAALVDNASTKPAQLDLIVTGDKDNLTMKETWKQ